MKKTLLALSFLALGTTGAFAASTTDMHSKWICTTNASSSNVEADKKADEDMKNKAGSAMSSFAFAAKHCRDCTKITCEPQS